MSLCLYRTIRQEDKKDNIMDSFDLIWQLLSPKIEYANRKRACYNLWQSFSEDKKKTVFNAIKDKKAKGLFVDYNPYFAIMKNSQLMSQRQVLSYADYYARFGTTEPRDGWVRTFLPDQQKTIYIKK